MTVKPPLPAMRSQYQAGGLFGNAENTVIHGGNFTSVGGGYAEKSGFLLLREHVAASAFHNSKQRLDPPRCHEHTREAIMEDLFEWIIGNVPRATWVAWLNGAAGAGKSAICQSMAEMCIKRGIKVASFFFFRTDSTRNTIDPLVATLAYQMIQLLPQTKDLITRAIEANPLIFEQSLETQFDVLIAEPLRHLPVSDPNWRLLLVIDGVDECDGSDNQKNLIRTIAKLLRPNDLPLIVLFGSRRENHILMAFSSKAVDEILAQFPLDDSYKAEEDIRRFLDDKFDEIKRTHPFKKSLAKDWPTASYVQEIVDKSSGQFIYASVVMNFLSLPSSNPAIQFDIVRGLRPTGRLTPFAQLDALYQHIFSQVVDLPSVLNLLAYKIFGKPDVYLIMLHFFEMEKGYAQSILAPLASVLGDINEDNITFRHASLPDFLRDKSRSQKYSISDHPTQLSILWFKKMASGPFRLNNPDNLNEDIPELLQHADTRDPDLYESLNTYDPANQPSVYRFLSGRFGSRFLYQVQNMDFGDEGKAYQRLLNIIIRYIHRECPHQLFEIDKVIHDLSSILQHIENENKERESESKNTAADKDLPLPKKKKWSRLKAWFR